MILLGDLRPLVLLDGVLHEGDPAHQLRDGVTRRQLLHLQLWAHTHTHAHALTHTHTHTHTLSMSSTQSQALKQTHRHALSFTHVYTHKHTHLKCLSALHMHAITVSVCFSVFVCLCVY